MTSLASFFGTIRRWLSSISHIGVKNQPRLNVFIIFNFLAWPIIWSLCEQWWYDTILESNNILKQSIFPRRTSRVQIIVSSFLSDKKVFGDNKKSFGLVSVRVPRSARGHLSESSIFFAQYFFFRKKRAADKDAKNFKLFSLPFCHLRNGARSQEAEWRLARVSRLWRVRKRRTDEWLWNASFRHVCRRRRNFKVLSSDWMHWWG